MSWAQKLLCMLSIVAYAACGNNPSKEQAPATASNDSAIVRTTQFSQQLEEVFSDSAYQLTGVAISHKGRLFVNYPYWLDKHLYSVVEVIDGKPIPYPDMAWNSFQKGEDGADKFVCVQAVFVDDKDFLWIVDPAGIGLAEVYRGDNKIVKVDLKTNKIVRIYRFPKSVAGKESYINDIRVDNINGFAYLTSCSNGGIVVLNINTGASRFVLHDHRSTQSDSSYHFVTYGKELANDKGPVKINADGIALSPDLNWLYYKPLTDNRLYRVSTKGLRDFTTSEEVIEKAVEDLGKFVTTDGMEFDSLGNLYVGDIENDRIVKIAPDKSMITLVEDKEKLIWPDSYSISADGYLYISCSQIQRMPWFNQDKNLTQLPYRVFRLKIL
jgi:sugar lactone lactonase YvrE